MPRDPVRERDEHPGNCIEKGFENIGDFVGRKPCTSISLAVLLALICGKTHVEMTLALICGKRHIGAHPGDSGWYPGVARAAARGGGGFEWKRDQHEEEEEHEGG
jgi:hypothetical protein